MPRRPQVRVAALPASALPELERVLAELSGGAGNRANVVMVRLDNRAVEHLDNLVEGGLAGSRSQAAAFLVGAGIRAQLPVLDRLKEHAVKLKGLRAAMKREALAALKARPRKTVS